MSDSWDGTGDPDGSLRCRHALHGLMSNAITSPLRIGKWLASIIDVAGSERFVQSNLTTVEMLAAFALCTQKFYQADFTQSKLMCPARILS